MLTIKDRPKTVADYIAAAPAEARAKLRQLRRCLLSAAPGATEALKWSMPALVDRRILMTYAAHRRHLGLYPTPAVMREFAPQLKAYSTGAGSIQFPLDRPLPLALIRKLARARVKQSRTQGRGWKT